MSLITFFLIYERRIILNNHDSLKQNHIHFIHISLKAVSAFQHVYNWFLKQKFVHKLKNKDKQNKSVLKKRQRDLTLDATRLNV